jgi:uncharacterized alkaline shock family protein YloU
MRRFTIKITLDVDSPEVALELAEDVKADISCMDGVERESVCVVTKEILN